MGLVPHAIFVHTDDGSSSRISITAIKTAKIIDRGEIVPGFDVFESVEVFVDKSCVFPKVGKVFLGKDIFI